MIEAKEETKDQKQDEVFFFVLGGGVVCVCVCVGWRKREDR